MWRLVCMLLIINLVSKPSYITQCLLNLNLDFISQNWIVEQGLLHGTTRTSVLQISEVMHICGSCPNMLLSFL